MKNYKTLLVAALMSATYLMGYSWGQKGHDTVCFIAENHLTDSTKNAVEKLLGGKSIVYYANWMDNASNTPEYKWSKTWHYKNIDADKTYETMPLNENGDVVSAILAMTNLLTNDTVKEANKSVALKMLVHLVGDVHQPMHVGHLSDRGGNSWKIKFFGSPTNLHSLWDSRLVESAHNWSYSEWQQQLDRVSFEEQQAIIADGTPDKWCKECYLIATDVYNNTPQEQNYSYDYISGWTPVIEQQFLYGGLRLADLLNSIFDPDYQGANLIVKK